MHCIVVDNSLSIRESLCLILLSLGIKGIPVASRKEALEKINNLPDIIAAIIDVDNKIVEGIALVKELKEQQKFKNIKIIIHTNNSSHDFVVNIIDMGIHGYLLKPFSEKKAINKLNHFLMPSNPSFKERRQHIRINIDPDELLRMHFKLPGYSNFISGKIRNISMGGLASVLLNPPDKKLLKSGTFVSRIEFILNTKQLSPSGMILLYKKPVLALHFNHFCSTDKSILARYIFKKISA